MIMKQEKKEIKEELEENMIKKGNRRKGREN